MTSTLALVCAVGVTVMGYASGRAGLPGGRV